MKLTILTILFAPLLIFAQSMPQAATEPMSTDEVLVTCTFENPDVDFQTVTASAQGILVAQINPKYVDGEIAPYLTYGGLKVTETKKSVRVEGSILSMAGPVKIDITVIRGKKTKVQILDQPVTCEVK